MTTEKDQNKKEETQEESKPKVFYRVPEALMNVINEYLLSKPARETMKILNTIHISTKKIDESGEIIK